MPGATASTLATDFPWTVSCIHFNARACFLQPCGPAAGVCDVQQQHSRAYQAIQRLPPSHATISNLPNNDTISPQYMLLRMFRQIFVISACSSARLRNFVVRYIGVPDLYWTASWGRFHDEITRSTIFSFALFGECGLPDQGAVFCALHA